MKKYLIILLGAAWLYPGVMHAQLGVLPGIKLYNTDLSHFINNGYNFKDVSVDTVNIFPAYVPLPCKQGGCTSGVTLAFEGRRADIDHGELKWVTTNEYNSKGFEIERAFTPDASQLKSIGFVESKENGGFKKEYHLTDNNSFEGISYYRLKQMDADSNYVYSDIIAIKGYKRSDDITLSPNPAHSTLNVAIRSRANKQATINIFDGKGMLVTQQQIGLLVGTVNTTVNVSYFPAGLFLLKVSSPGGGDMIARFIKN